MVQQGAETSYPSVAPRYPLIAEASVTDVDTGTQLHCRTCDISASGCYLDTMNPFSSGTRVQVLIRHKGEIFSAFGSVPYAQPNMGMGLRFERVAADQQARLQQWLAELSGASQS